MEYLLEHYDSIDSNISFEKYHKELRDFSNYVEITEKNKPYQLFINKLSSKKNWLEYTSNIYKALNIVFFYYIWFI